MKKGIIVFLLAGVFLMLAVCASAGIRRIDYNGENNTTSVVYEFFKGDNPWNIYRELFPEEKVSLEKVRKAIMEPNNIQNAKCIPVGKKIVVISSKLNYLKTYTALAAPAPIAQLPRIDGEETQQKLDNLKMQVENLEILVRQGQKETIVRQIPAESNEEIIKEVKILNHKLDSRSWVDIVYYWVIIALLAIVIILQLITSRRAHTHVIASIFLVAMIMGCAAPKLVMQDVNTGLAGQAYVGRSMLIEPHQSLGLEPTPSIREGNISTYLVVLPLDLFGEYYPGRLRWNAWAIKPDGRETFGQVIFSGVHPSGEYFGTMIFDGQILSGHAAILSTAVDFIYSPLGKELPVEREKFLTDAMYRSEKIKEVNSSKDGNIFNLSELSWIDGFETEIKIWNQIQYPEGYLISPYGVEEVAAIRGINPQYSYFQKLIGSGKFRLNPVPHPVGFAISNSIGLLMDFIAAGETSSNGWDFKSQMTRRDWAFTIKYLLTLAKKEIQLRNKVNVQLLQAREAPRRSP